MNWLSALKSTKNSFGASRSSITLRKCSTTSSRSATPCAVIHCALQCFSCVLCPWVPVGNVARSATTTVAKKGLLRKNLLVAVMAVHLIGEGQKRGAIPPAPGLVLQSRPASEEIHELLPAGVCS